MRKYQSSIKIDHNPFVITFKANKRIETVDSVCKLLAKRFASLANKFNVFTLLFIYLFIFSSSFHPKLSHSLPLNDIKFQPWMFTEQLTHLPKRHLCNWFGKWEWLNSTHKYCGKGILSAQHVAIMLSFVNFAILPRPQCSRHTHITVEWNLIIISVCTSLSIERCPANLLLFATNIWARTIKTGSQMHR